MLDTPTLTLLNKALDYASTRQEVLANNIANSNTPGYHRKDASFADVLAYAEGGAPARIAQINDNSRHFFASGQNGQTPVEVIETGEGAMRMDGNNVDMDAEMSRLAQNQIYYDTCTQLMSTQFVNLKSIIEGH